MKLVNGGGFFIFRSEDKIVVGVLAFIVYFWLLTGSAFAAFEQGLNNIDLPVPDDDSWVYNSITISGAPNGATVTSVDVYFKANHAYPTDLWIDLTDNGDPLTEVRLWDRDDTQDNPFTKTTTGITAFNGLDVNQTWSLWGRDVAADDTGFIDSWWIKVYYTGGYSIAGNISNIQYGTNADGDSYYETYSFDITTDTDGPSSPAIYSRIYCTSTGQDWWTSSFDPPSTGTGSFDQTDFNVSGNTSLGFTVQVWSTPNTSGILLAEDTYVSGEPIYADKYTPSTSSNSSNDDESKEEVPWYQNCGAGSIAHGSYLEKFLDDLRSFRDKYLKTNKPGKALVKFYYTISPSVASFMGKHENIRVITRYIVAPIFLGLAYPRISLLILLFLSLYYLSAKLGSKERGEEVPAGV